jgi:hypothetical protein
VILSGILAFLEESRFFSTGAERLSFLENKRIRGVKSDED